MQAFCLLAVARMLLSILRARGGRESEGPKIMVRIFSY